MQSYLVCIAFIAFPSETRTLWEFMTHRLHATTDELRVGALSALVALHSLHSLLNVTGSWANSERTFLLCTLTVAFSGAYPACVEDVGLAFEQATSTLPIDAVKAFIANEGGVQGPVKAAMVDRLLCGSAAGEALGVCKADLGAQVRESFQRKWSTP
jgi:hypothetical protein